MSLIEGVGDEVTNFFMIVGMFIIAYVAWSSTRISDQPLIRTVLIFQRRSRSRINESQTNQEVLNLAENQHTNLNNNQPEEESSQEVEVEELNSSAQSQNINDNEEIQASTNAEPSEEELIQTMDSNIEEANGMGEVNDNSNDTVTPESLPEDVAELHAEEKKDEIAIKLKFINDDQKLVTGNLKEPLGDFKKRYFHEELEARKLVKLVFKGKVVQPDNLTLERCGFYDNCVVHCLIHQSHAPPGTSNNSSSRFYFNPPSYQNVPASPGINSIQNDWDLSRLLVSVLTLILGLAWYFRYHYAQLFTVTTTMGLFGLTAIFTVSLFGHFFPDQEIRNVE